MGLESSDTSGKRQLRVANINFSGFQVSPFEYYSDQHRQQQQEINTLFKNQLQLLRPENQKQLFGSEILQEISKIDRKIKTQRNSPLYNKRCGIIKGKFYDEEQFHKIKRNFQQKIQKIQNQRKQKKLVCVGVAQIKKSALNTTDKYMLKLQQIFNMIWDITLEEGEGWKKMGPFNFKLQHRQDSGITRDQYQFYEQRYVRKRKQLNNLRKFDFIVYISILKYVYEKVDLQTIVNNRSCSKYLQFMKSFFSKPHLNNNKKTFQVIKFLKQKQIDVLFMQEATDQFCTQLERQSNEYRIIRSQYNLQDPGYSLIILKQKSLWKADVGRKGNLKFKQIIDRLKYEEQQKFLQWGKTAFISISNFIFISVNKKQFDQRMKGDIQFIKKKFPLKYVVIGATFSQGKKIGGELRNLQQFYQTYPKNKITVFKKRTFIQFQKQKANKLIAAQYNHIIYDKRLQKNDSTFSKIQKDNSNKISDGVYTLDDQIINQDATGSNKNQTNRDIFQDQMSLFPNDVHLFDQLIVLKNLNVPKKKQKKPEQQQLKKQQRERLGFETSSSQQDNQTIQNPQI